MPARPLTEYELLMLALRHEFPRFRLAKKQESSWMKFLNKLLLVISFGQMKNFMGYTTTIGYTIYVGSGWDKMSDEKQSELLRHERVHMRQRAQYGFFLFALLYLFLPFPIFFALWRVRFEQAAYEESMRCVLERKGGAEVLSGAEYRRRMVDHFTGPAYLWAWYSRKSIEAWYDKFTTKIITVKKNSSPPGKL